MSSIVTVPGDVTLNVPTEQTTTATGTQSDFSLSAVYTHLRCNNTTALTLTGFTVGGATPTHNCVVIIDNIGSSTVKVSNQDTGSTAANRCITPSSNGQIIGANGRMMCVYDVTTQRWRESLLDPGARITVPYNSGDFTGQDSMTWTVDSGDLRVFAYRQSARAVHIMLAIEASSVGGTPSESLLVAFPGGFTPSDSGSTAIYLATTVMNNGTLETGRVTPGSSVFEFARVPGTNWTASSNATRVYCNTVFRVD